MVEDKGCMAGCLSAIGIGTRYNEKTFNMLVLKEMLKDSNVLLFPDD